jgi:hypothetical protein
MRRTSFGLVALTFISLGSFTAAHAMERVVHLSGGYATGTYGGTGYYGKGDDDGRWYGKSGRDGGSYSKGDRDDRWYGKGGRDGGWYGKGDRDGVYTHGGVITRRVP